MKRLFFTLILSLFAALGANEFCYNFSFEEIDASITDSGPAKLKGTYHPSADRDNDTPETTNPKRFRKPGVAGNALFFTAEYQSYGILENPIMRQNIDSLYLKVHIKTGSPKTQVIVGNKTDSGNAGFSLSKRGRQWSFRYADGEKTYQATAPVQTTESEGWIELAVCFHRGQIRISENGQIILNQEFPGKTIAASKNNLIIGNYPSKNKKVYAFDGGLDELVIADSPETAAKYAVTVPTAAKAVLALCEPVDGYEKHFGGQKTLNSFAAYPVPATFVLSFSKAKSPVLAITVPEGVTIPEAFSSNHNVPSKQFKFETRTDAARTEYRTAPGELRGNLEGRFGRGENVTLVFNTPPGFTSGQIQWAVYDDGELQHQDSFLLNLIESPAPLPPGKFQFMCYTSQDIAFYSPEIFRRIGELFARSGITGKGRYYKSDKRRAPLDEILRRDFGFTLYEISLWGGPLKGHQAYRELIGPAIGPNGKKLSENCPVQLVSSPEAVKKYAESAKEKLIIPGTKAAILDFEPWSRTAKFCFCDICLAEFKKNFRVADDPLTPETILKKYRTEWTSHWVSISYRYMKMMADAVRAAAPDMEVWDYTYVFPYNDADAMNQRLWYIPKNPQLNEDFLDASMLSIYHLDGRKAFDQVELSRKHLKKKICSISLISRANANTGNYTAPEECLSPQQLYQKAVMMGALGHEIFGIYPGHWIDGAVHVNLNRAAAVIRQHEQFYLDGIRRDEALKITTQAARDHYAYTIHEKNGTLLVTLFNFTASPLNFEVEKLGQITVPPQDVVLKTITATP